MTKRKRLNPAEILLINNNPEDYNLFKEVMRESNINLVTSGTDAMALLRKQGQYSGSNDIDLIFLDLDLTDKNGFEILKEIKSGPELKIIPVIVLSNSTNNHEITNSYKLYANAFIKKSEIHAEFVEELNVTESFWLSVVNLPKDNNYLSNHGF